METFLEKYKAVLDKNHAFILEVNWFQFLTDLFFTDWFIIFFFFATSLLGLRLGLYQPIGCFFLLL